MSMKNSKSGIELATFRLVCQCLNQVCHRVPHQTWKVNNLYIYFVCPFFCFRFYEYCTSENSRLSAGDILSLDVYFQAFRRIVFFILLKKNSCFTFSVSVQSIFFGLDTNALDLLIRFSLTVVRYKPESDIIIYILI